MKFKVDPRIFAKFPGVEIGVIAITGMNNRGHKEEILKLFRDEEKHQKDLLTGVELSSLPEIAIWRKIYTDFGSNKDYRSSVESLLRRARGGEKLLPQINNLVDLYNYLSLKYHLPIGAEDLDKVVGDIELTFADGSEKGKYIGSETEDICYAGEIIYKDKTGFICRRWNWREADRTKIDFDTVNSVLVIEKASALEKENFQKALEEGKELIQKHLSGKIQTFVLEKIYPSFEISFKREGRIVKTEKALHISPIKPIPETFLPVVSLFPEDKNSLSYHLRQIILRACREVIGEKEKIEFDDLKIEHPTNKNYGDYATNVALMLGGKLKIKPIDLAKKVEEKIYEYIKTNQKITVPADSNKSSDSIINPSDILEKIEVAGQGFLNLWLRKDYLITELAEVLKKDYHVRSIQLSGKKIAVEYTDPNPFKEFHLGHLYSNVIGEAIARLFQACGAVVWRGDFYGDVGMHVAKSVWGMMEKMKREKLDITNLEEWSLDKRVKFLGQGYAMGVTKYEEDKQIQEEIKDLNYLVYVAGQEVLKINKGWQPIINYRKYIKGKEDKLPAITQVYEAGLRWSLEYFETIYKRLGTKFDGYYPESWVGEYGMKLVEKGLNMGVLEKSEGGVVYRGEKDGLHTRVFVNKLGLPTYEAKDLGLAYAKYQDFKYDLSINVFGREIDEYYKVVRAAMRKIEPELGKKAYYIAHGMVKLPKGKMSSRTGNVLTFEWLMDEAKKHVLKIMKEVDLSESEKQKVVDVVGMGAVRYALLKNSPGNDVIFDFNKSVSLEGNSGPYLQYTYARCKSVLRKASGEDISGVTGWSGRGSNDSFKEEELIKQLNPEELSLLRTFYRLPEVVLEACMTFSPNLICSFLFDLAQIYNLFYQKHSILNPSSRHLESGRMDSFQVEESARNFRLLLTQATAAVLKKGLYLLGIETVERM